MERSASAMTDAKFGLTLIAVSVPVLLVHELAVSWRRVQNALHGLMLVPGETDAKEVNGKSRQTLQVFRPRRVLHLTVSNAGLIASGNRQNCMRRVCLWILSH